MLKRIIKIRIALLHATYHRSMKRAEKSRQRLDIVEFKKYVYAAEDAWRKLVILSNKLEPNG
jgi:hypothetical protein